MKKAISHSLLRGQEGFTMIEVLSSMAIMGFVCAIYIQFSVTSALSSGHAVKSSVATSIVESVAEDLSMVPMSNAWLLSASEITPDITYPFQRFFTRDCKETKDITQAFYTVSWTVTLNQPIVGAKSIAMIVKWTEGNLARQLGMRVIR